MVSEFFSFFRLVRRLNIQTQATTMVSITRKIPTAKPLIIAVDNSGPEPSAGPVMPLEAALVAVFVLLEVVLLAALVLLEVELLDVVVLLEVGPLDDVLELLETELIAALVSLGVVKNPLLASALALNLAAKRSSLGHVPESHGLLEQQPKKGRSPAWHVYQSALLSAHSWGAMSLYLSALNEARSRSFSGHVPEPSTHGSTVQHPMNSTFLPWQM